VWSAESGGGAWGVVACGLAESVFSACKGPLITEFIGWNMKRRTVLKQAGAVAGTIAVAGCLSEGSGGGDETESTTSESDDTESTTEPTETASMSLSVKSVETTGSSCESEDSASVAFSDDGASIEGKIPASNPCHEAAFVDATLESGSLSVTMEAVEKDVDACQQCLATVSYSAGVETDDGVPSSVTVKHKANGETSTVAEASN